MIVFKITYHRPTEVYMYKAFNISVIRKIIFKHLKWNLDNYRNSLGQPKFKLSKIFFIQHKDFIL